MKFCSPFPLLFCLCITIAAGAYSNYGHPRHVNTRVSSKRMLQSHIVKKQANSDSRVCDAAISRVQCTSGYVEDFTYLEAQCNFPIFTTEAELATATLQFCGKNSMGVICGTIQPDEDILEQVCGISPTTCTPECRDLITITRDQKGCCVNGHDITNFFLSLCGVEPVSEVCTLDFDLPTVDVDPTCDANLETYSQRSFFHLECREEYFDSFRDELNRQGCNNELEDFFDPSVCRADDQGRYCIPLDDDLHDQENIVSDNCIDTSICDPACIETLNNAIDLFGCCFISEFNSTTSPEPQSFDWLSSEFFQRCGLTSPGLCEPRFTSGPRISFTLPEPPRTSGTIRTAPGIAISFTVLQFIVVFHIY